jgi:hypothetical protein
VLIGVFWVGELGLESVLFSWSKVALMVGKNSMSASRYCHCHLQCWENTSAMLGCSATRVSGRYDGCDKPLFETSNFEVGGSSVPCCGVDRTLL